jgi:phage terminase small subunit
MAKRGPKLATGNARPRECRGRCPASPSKLAPEAAAEFKRLVRVLRQRGALERVDLAVVAEASRVKALLDDAHEWADVRDHATISVVNTLTAQRRGLLRELGLTLQPSRSLIRTDAVDVDAQDADPLGSLIRITG